MTDNQPDMPERHKNIKRNVAINTAVSDLERIINNSDPEGPIIANAVWDRLDKMAVEVEEISRADLSRPEPSDAARKDLDVGQLKREYADAYEFWDKSSDEFIEQMIDDLVLSGYLSAPSPMTVPDKVREILEELVKTEIRDNGDIRVVEGDLASEALALLDQQAVPDMQIIDLDVLGMEAIKKAASESKWMPPEYTMNDWVSDVCRFLRDGRSEMLADLREKVEGMKRDEPDQGCVWTTADDTHNAALDAVIALIDGKN